VYTVTGWQNNLYYTDSENDYINVMIDEENDTPSTVKEALTSDHADKWKEAIDTEMDRINIRKCFSICDEKDQNDPTKKATKSKFVFKLKLNNDNKTYKHKV
jgi:hypothetical protein